MVKETPFSAGTRLRWRRQPWRLPPSRRMNSFRRSRTSSAGTAAGSDGEAISKLDVCSAVWIIGVLLEVGEYGDGRARPRSSRAHGREYGYSAEEHAESHPTSRVGAKSNRFRHSSVTPGSARVLVTRPFVGPCHAGLSSRTSEPLALEDASV